jgi:hypothetical protein
MRSIWKGSINFGLVNIPVAVYPATRDEKVSFKQLRKSDLSPIRYKKVAEADEKEVPAAEIVKGYEYEKGKWVVLEDKDFEQVQIESTHSIEITDFIEGDEVKSVISIKCVDSICICSKSFSSKWWSPSTACYTSAAGSREYEPGTTAMLILCPPLLSAFATNQSASPPASSGVRGG